MHNCIFTAHCTESLCDESCPILVETSYLLERNGISMNSFVFSESAENINKMSELLKSSKNTIHTYIADNVSTVKAAELLTYCAICQNWQGNRLHCNVYNLKFSSYIDALKKSWSTRAEPEELEYMRIWSASAKVLIISNLDYVNFGNFESQTLLNLLQSRDDGSHTTVVVSPNTSCLIGNSSFFNTLCDILNKNSSNRKAVNGT